VEREERDLVVGSKVSNDIMHKFVIQPFMWEFHGLVAGSRVSSVLMTREHQVL